jgi:tRNA-Thr(GGU) m(6)t(6)A37 methyltransferase TsaA
LGRIIQQSGGFNGVAGLPHLAYTFGMATDHDNPGAGPADSYGVRAGETTVELPAAFDAGLYFIGRIRTPWTRREDCPKNARESDAICRIEVDPRYAPALLQVETCSHLIVLYWMEHARRDLIVQRPRHYGDSRGTFALRSPARPNPIALSVVSLLKVEGNVLTIRHIDCLDNTPLIDIKPYFASVDSVPDAVVGWHRDKKAPER